MEEYWYSCQPWLPSPQVKCPQDTLERRLDKTNIWSGNSRNRRHIRVPGTNPTVLGQSVNWLTMFSSKY